MADIFSHPSSNGTRYYLNSKRIRFKGQLPRTIFFFSRDRRDRSTACAKPMGYDVTENPSTGFPVLKKDRGWTRSF